VLDSIRSGSLLADASKWKTQAPKWGRRGVGIACAWHGFTLGPGFEPGAEVWAELTAEGRWRISVGCPDLGQGNLAAFAKIAAEKLGCSAGEIEIRSGDTDGPDSEASDASRTVYVVGNAIAEATTMLRDKVDRSKGSGPMRVVHCYEPKVRMSQVPGLPHISFTPAALVVGLEIDELTGQVDVLRMEQHVNPGRVVSPEGVRGQLQGALVQGLGFALLEDIIMKDGRVINDKFASYLIPTVMDVPHELETKVVTTPDATSPLGVRGVGEIGLVPVAAAIGNALHDALGCRFSRFPITTDAVLSVLEGGADE
jgi:CO/xanthine dehydrogenase Mo-binding subunit